MNNSRQPASHSKPDWIARTVSVAGLLASAIALWYSALAPADITASVSAPLFIWRAQVETSTSENAAAIPKLMLKASCSFANGGAHSGEVNYIALRFVSDDGTKWVFAPYWVVDDAKLLSDGYASRTWIKEPFHPIRIPGRQSVDYSFMFYAESGLHNFSDADLTAHKFKVTLLTWMLGDESPNESQVSTLNFDKDLIRHISAGTLFGMPFMEQQRQMQQLK